MSTPDFLRNAGDEGFDQDALKRLESLVEAFQERESNIAELEERLKEERAAADRLGRTDIPELLRAHGLSEVRLANKKKVVVAEGVSVSVPDDKAEAFKVFMADQKAEDLFKLTISFTRMEAERREALLQFLVNNDYDFDTKDGVHPSTLKKFVSDLLGLNLTEEERAEAVAEGRCLRLDDLRPFMSVFTYYTTKIK